MQKPKEKKETELKILNQYVHLLKDYHEQIGIKIPNSNKYTKSKLSVDIFEVAQKLDGNINMLKKKHKEYEDWLPKYEKELEECKENFDKVFKKAKSTSKKAKDEIKNKLEFAFKTYDSLEDDLRDDLEVKNILYKDLKILLSL